VSDGAVVATLYDPAKDGIVIDDYSLSADEQQLLIVTGYEAIYRRSGRAENYLYDLKTNELRKLSTKGKQQFATLSPDGKKVAFVRNNNLFVIDLESMTESPVTRDGKTNEIINGAGDWVYEEELSLSRAFEWSGDSQKLAFYRFDESQVREYNMQKWGKLYPEDYKFKYPKAGEANAKVKIMVYNLPEAKTISIDTGTETDLYIARINWTHDHNLLSVRRLNRLQNKLEILHANATTGAASVVWTDQSNTYIDIDAVDEIVYLPDNKGFIALSERSGYKHLYQFDMDGKLTKTLTSGNWQVDKFYGLDPIKQVLYFTSTEVSATEVSPLERHLYSLKLIDDSPKKKASKTSIFEPIKTKLSTLKGWHTANFSKDYQYFILYHSSADSPNFITLHKAPNGQQVKVLEDNQALKTKLADYELVNKEFFDFKTPENIALNGWMIKPQGFDPTKKYPVLMFVYGGPGSQTVMNAWDARDFYWYQVLAQKGYIIVSVDNRGTGGRGVDFQKSTYKQLGKYETLDQIEAAKYLAKMPFVAPSRIGIWGWSYGGYMSSNCIMQGAEVFKTAIAVAPVTSWRYYDSIYTERYLQTPQLNTAGYDDNSPINHVSKLKGNYFLIHGTGDDNVHFQNAVMLEDALIKANKQFRSFYYPNKSHGISGGNTRLHLYTMMTEFLMTNL
jgi:dipeptidyl-peptidase 4